MSTEADKPEKIIRGETGLQKNLGYVNHIFADRCETHLQMDDRHTNRHGGLHGGLHAILLDSACGFAASRGFSAEADQLVVTVTLTTNYLAPAGDHDIRAVGRVTTLGRSIAYAHGEVFDGQGTLLATGSGVFKKMG